MKVCISKSLIASSLLCVALVGCGGSGISTSITGNNHTGGGTSIGGSSSGSSSGGTNSGGSTSPTSLAEICAVPRPAGTINPDTGTPYGDVQGTLTNEMAWIASFVNFTYLWYPDVPVVSSAPYVIGATVPYTDPTTNTAGTKTLATNYDVVDAYFNSQRSPLFTASGKPKDQFHFTYTTTDWQQLSTQGNEAGFGFDVEIIAATPPRQNVIAFVTPGSPADQNGLKRGMQFISVNGVSVANGSDVTTLNDGLFTPTLGTAYTFVVLDPTTNMQSTVTMTATNITLVPVTNVQTLPAPYSSVGYMLYTDQIAPAEQLLYNAITALKSDGITDLVLDLRYNGGGYLDLASELSYMIAGPTNTTGTTFEQDTYNNKNPFGLTTAQTIVPFHNVTQGFSMTKGQALPQLNLKTVYVITGSGTCSASEAIMNGLIGIGVKVVQIGATTCGKPYGFFPQDNCGTTYFTIQFEGVNNAGFGAYADGFIPGGTGTTANNLPGCAVADDYTKQLGDPTEARLAAALQYRSTGTCPAAATGVNAPNVLEHKLFRSPARENRILRKLGAN